MAEKTNFAKVRPPHTKGIDMLERAMHELDLEAEKHLSQLPEELLRRMAQIEHCHLVLHQSLRRHLPEELAERFPEPTEAFSKKVTQYRRQMGLDAD